MRRIAIVITNLSKQPFIGKKSFFPTGEVQVGKASVHFSAIAGPDTGYLLERYCSGAGLHRLPTKKTRQYGVLTQRVRNGKIIYESAIFKDAELFYEYTD